MCTAITILPLKLIVINKIILKGGVMFDHTLVQYQSQKQQGNLRSISGQRLHQQGANKEFHFSDNS